MLARRTLVLLVTFTALALAGCGPTVSGGSSGHSDEDKPQGSAPKKNDTPASETESEEPKAPEHEDEFTIVDARTQALPGTDEYYDIVVTVKNNTDSEKLFQGFSVKELDASGNIIDSYMSYNKNAVQTVVAPGQQLDISLTTAKSSGVAGISSDGYEYGDMSSTTTGTFSQPFTKMF